MPSRRYEMVETLKQETRKKKELEKRFRKKGDAAGEGADDALERLDDGGTSSDDSDSDDEMKLKETQEAGAFMMWDICLKLLVRALAAMLRVVLMSILEGGKPLVCTAGASRGPCHSSHSQTKG